MKPAPCFLLVHGAWHGGWCWAQVVGQLEQQGLRSYAPTLRGLAHRAAELTSELNADDHVRDVADLAEALDLQRIVLVLHSYAGLLGPALLARLRPRLAHIAWVEAVMPEPGQCMLDLVLPEAAQRYQRLAREQGDGWRLPVPDVAQFHLGDPALAAEAARRLTPHPLRTFAEPVRLPQDDVLRFPGSYLIASDRDPQPYTRFAEAARAAGWRVQAMPGGHLPMLTQPRALAEYLRSLSNVQEDT